MIIDVIDGLGYQAQSNSHFSTDEDFTDLNINIKSNKFTIKEMDRTVKLWNYFYNNKKLVENGNQPEDNFVSLDYGLKVEDEAIILNIDAKIPNSLWGLDYYKNKIAKKILYGEYPSTTLGGNTLFCSSSAGFIDANSFMLSIKTKNNVKLRNVSEWSKEIFLNKPNQNNIYRFSFMGDFEIESAKWISSNGMAGEI
jgi:hypothetical protein